MPPKLKLPKAPKVKLKEYNEPDDAKYVVVAEPWADLPSNGDNKKVQSFSNNVGGWFEKMLGPGARVSAIFHMLDKRRHVIVELPYNVDVRSILGAHYTERFMKTGLIKPPTFIYEYNFKRFGHPGNKLGFTLSTPTYSSKDLPHLFAYFHEDYPVPSLPPPPKGEYNALPIPMDVSHRLTQGKLERSNFQPVASSSFLTDSASSTQGLKPPVPASSSSPSHLPPTPPRSNPPPLTAAPPSPPNPSNEPPAQVSSSSDPNAFTPYTRPSHLYPAPGGGIVRAETHEPGPIAGPSKTSSSPPPSSRNRSSPSPPPPSLSPPLPPPPPLSSSSSKFTKRDPYEEEEEAKLLVQNTNTTFIKPEPVDVKLEPDVDVRVKLESEMDVDSSVSLRVKPDPEMDVDSCISLGAKPEPMDTSIPQEAFDRYMSHISTNANVDADVRVNADSEPANESFDSASVSRAQSHPIRVKTEPGGEHGVLAESVRVKPEPVENGISEDLFDLYMRHQHQHQRESSRDDMSLDEEGSARVKREPELKSEEVEEGEGVGRVGQQGSARVKREPELKSEEEDEEGVGRLGQQGRELTPREQTSESETVRVKPEPVDNNHNLSNTRGRNTFVTRGSGSKGKRWRAERTDAVDGRMHERNDGSSGPGSMSNAHRGPHQNPRPIKRGNGDKHDWSSGERKRQRVEQWVKISGGAGKKRKG